MKRCMSKTPFAINMVGAIVPLAGVLTGAVLRATSIVSGQSLVNTDD